MEAPVTIIGKYSNNKYMSSNSQILIFFFLLSSHDGDHGHSHGHSHGDSQIMKGVFLHILADTLGSVGVIVSAILMYLWGWMIADPICSIFIALLIAISVGSLVSESVAILMQRQPKELDQKLPECYNKVK